MANPSNSPTSSPAFQEASLLLIVWSLLVYTEGAIRLNDTAPSISLFASGRPPKLIAFSAALSEMLFGLLGLLIGLYAFFTKSFHKNFTVLSMVIQTVLGYYVFAVYIFVLPIYTIVDLETPMVEGLSISESRAVISFGILTSFNFCLALQGGQFIFLARLVAAGTDSVFLGQGGSSSGTRMDRMRAVFWNVNLLLSGLWTFVTGLIVAIAADDFGELDAPFVSPPNVSVLPLLTAVTGALMFGCGVVGSLHAVLERKITRVYYGGVAFVLVWMILMFGVVQFGMFGSGVVTTSGAVAMHDGLVFMVVFLPVYFLQLSFRKRERVNAS